MYMPYTCTICVLYNLVSFSCHFILLMRYTWADIVDNMTSYSYRTFFQCFKSIFIADDSVELIYHVLATDHMAGDMYVYVLLT